MNKPAANNRLPEIPPLPPNENSATKQKAHISNKHLKIATILCLITTLLSFNRLPAGIRFGSSGFSYSINIIALLAWISGIWITLHFFRKKNQIKKAGSAYWVLSILAIVFFSLNAGTSIARTALEIAGIKKVENPGMTAAGFAPMATMGKEIWDINGKKYQIRATYYLNVQNDLQYTIEYEYPEARSINNENQALEVAMPLIKYAYTSGKYKRTTFHKFGKKQETDRIGVAIFVQQGNSTRGYRTALTLDQIKTEIQSSETSNSE